MDHSLPPPTLHHEGFFWRCRFQSDPSLHVVWAVLFSEYKACTTEMLNTEVVEPLPFRVLRRFYLFIYSFIFPERLILCNTVQIKKHIPFISYLSYNSSKHNHFWVQSQRTSQDQSPAFLDTSSRHLSRSGRSLIPCTMAPQVRLLNSRVFSFSGCGQKSMDTIWSEIKGIGIFEEEKVSLNNADRSSVIKTRMVINKNPFRRKK